VGLGFWRAKISEVYKADGGTPDPWDKLDRSKQQWILDENLEQIMVARQSKKAKIEPFFFPSRPLSQEVRINRMQREP
jgi:hypothetical protein